MVAFSTPRIPRLDQGSTESRPTQGGDRAPRGPCPATACAVLASLVLSLHATTFAQVVTVSTPTELNTALRSLNPGTTVRIAPGTYRGGVHLQNVQGRPDARIVLTAADTNRPPLFTGGNVGLHLSACSQLTVSHLVLQGFPGNGINADDGGRRDQPSRGLRFEHLRVLETGPRGNHDGLKLSGLEDFVVRGCHIEGWGGEGIDMVGCHRGVIEDCALIGREGFSQVSGVQMKGGSSDIVVQTSFFQRAGHRGVNIGGGTGLQFFRPAVQGWEAKDIIVAGNRFTGGTAPVVWATASGGVFRHNTVHLPEKWVARILQDGRGPQFQPCHGGVFERNLVVFDRNVAVFVNVGDGTRPESFTFRQNAWFEVNGSRRPRLPAEEAGGVYQADPRLSQPGTAAMKRTSTDPRLANIGADAHQRIQR